VDAQNLTQWIFDTLTGLGLLCLAWMALASSQLIKAIVLFVAFGLLMALTWVRLDAVDIALAEVAIGAGLTGALLLAALAKLTAVQTATSKAAHRSPKDRAARKLYRMPAALLLLVAAGLAYSVLSLPLNSRGLSIEVGANLDASGVGNPVTAVLLNFRGYDTLLEIFVLFLALLGVWSLGSLPPHRIEPAGPVLNTLVVVLAPLLILLAAYFLWAGAHGPGGAFQAGATLGAAGVLLQLAGWKPGPGFARLPWKLILLAGPALFILFALFTLVTGQHLLEYAPERAGILILLLETGATFSIGLTLAALFFGERPDDAEGR